MTRWRLTTTPYDLMAALQAVMGPDNDARVVTAVGYLVRCGRLTGRGTDSAC